MARKSQKKSGRDQIKVNEYSLQWLKKGFDWVYKKEITSSLKGFRPGSILRILSQKGDFLGVGVFDSGPLSVRRFREDDGPLDLEFFKRRFQEALMRRPSFGPEASWRWVHGENDDLPGIRVDVWGNELCLTLASTSLRPLIPTLVEALSSLRDFKAVWGHIRTEDNKVLGLLHGQSDGEGHWVYEHGLKYWVQPSRSPDAGLFSDMRNLRSWLQPQWQGKRVLNLFCFTGAFSVSAAANGANSVHSVDLSPTYINWTRKNFQENQLQCSDEYFIVSDAIKALDKFRRKQKNFDLIIADPPSYSHSDHGTWSVQNGLTSLLIACLRCLAPGGILIAATNYGKMSPKDFSKSVRDAGIRVGRRLRILQQYNPPADFPAAVHFPESRYLKCWVLQG